MAPEALHYMELVELTRRMHAKEISPVEATRAELDRIAMLDKSLRSYALVTPEAALEQARQAEAEISRNEIKGPLHGAPIAVKDLCWTAGVATAAGMTIHRDFRPDEDATVVRKLRAAGAIILGKLQLTEGAFADHHPKIPPPVNPWNAAHWPGASSSGSGVATAAGLCYASLGSDTGGSIRFPSAANGVTGLKPTWGRVSRYGVFELAATLDHIGPMARSAADTAAMLGVIAGRDEKDPTASLEPVPDYLARIDGGIRGLRIGVDVEWNRRGTDATMVRAVNDATEIARQLGGEIREVKVPDPSAVIADWVLHCGIETAVAHEATYPARKSEYGPALAGLIDAGRAASAMDYQKILLHRHDFSGRLRALFETIDLLLIPAQAFASPTMADMATLGEDPEKLAALLRYTCPFDVSGSPTITLPCGFTPAGTPIACQFVAPHFREEILFRAGKAYQNATDWHHRHPALAEK
ncbi:amidase [Rhodopila globiformis]|uniref:Amidase n=1 Tax=Rhodopila globiformis TaxID=1071 RepID=A0A2S6NH03_RHOGL|nr:amidase [Rhodopila globiformis]PPQ33874.1 amidase [Rhodopila globiformis]